MTLKRTLAVMLSIIATLCFLGGFSEEAHATEVLGIRANYTENVYESDYEPYTITLYDLNGFELITPDGNFECIKGQYGWVPKGLVPKLGAYYYNGDELIKFDEVTFDSGNQPWTADKENYYTIYYKDFSCKVPVTFHQREYVKLDFVSAADHKFITENDKNAGELDDDTWDATFFWYYNRAIKGDKVILTKRNGEKEEYTYSGSGRWEIEYVENGRKRSTAVGFDEQPDQCYENRWLPGNTYRYKGVECMGLYTTLDRKVIIVPKNPTNPLSVRGLTVNAKYSKKKNQSFAKCFFFDKKGKGTITYAKASGNSKITVSKTTGKITVKKGLKKGTYKVKVKVRAAGKKAYGRLLYKAKTVTTTVKVRVK